MSRKLVVAIDCDDVLVDAGHYIIDTYNKTHGTQARLEDAHDMDAIGWGTDSNTVLRRIHDIWLSPEYASREPLPGAIDTVRHLSEQHELHLVTARSSSITSVTEAMVDTYFAGCFSSIEHVGPRQSKGDIYKDITADVVVDDGIGHMQKAYALGIKHLLLFGRYPWNQNDMGVPVTRVNDWVEVRAYFDQLS